MQDIFHFSLFHFSLLTFGRPLSRLCILEIMIFNVLTAPSVRKNSKLFGFSLAYSYLWLHRARRRTSLIWA